MGKKRINAKRLLGLAILPAVALATTMTVDPTPSEAREYRANLKSYCKQFRMSSWGFYKKQRRFKCQRISMGFNTTYVSKTRNINLKHLCRQQYGTSLWRYRGSAVYCIKRNYSVIKLCNDMNHPIYTAFADYDGGHRRGWVSRGWYKAPARGCKTINLGREYRGKVYVYAEGGGDSWSGRAASFCIDANRGFELANSGRRSCQRPGLRRVGMNEFRVHPGHNVWRFR